MSNLLQANQYKTMSTEHQYQRYKFLFENSPVPIHETNISNVSEAINTLKIRGVEKIEDYIAAHPDFISQLFYDSDIFDVNDAMLIMTEAPNKSYYLENFKLILGEPCFQFFQAIVIETFYGRNRLTGQTQITTFKGNKIWIEATAMFLSMDGEEIINYTFKEITEKKIKDDAIRLINSRLVTGTFQEHFISGNADRTCYICDAAYSCPVRWIIHESNRRNKRKSRFRLHHFVPGHGAMRKRTPETQDRRI